ncbi:hypothetical protein NC653_024098 [Populus alba x Populus x berolinensis]|uniref:Uncharacterized protein n=1 Tax=Populus alba x Populus x berolinensis TaxID=444605 RepID=A0AAD6M8L5_9ROSI|nr:hypothetical protein NC653_024098 [Populus alba x Populus x berolinensis]
MAPSMPQYQTMTAATAVAMSRNLPTLFASGQISSSRSEVRRQCKSKLLKPWRIRISYGLSCSYSPLYSELAFCCTFDITCPQFYRFILEVARKSGSEFDS